MKKKVKTIETSSNFSAEKLSYGIAESPWLESLGNYRVLLSVVDKVDAVWAHIPWRRRDKSPEDKKIIIIDSTTGKEIENFVRIDINREFGDIVFQPKTVPGKYELYYMPYNVTGTWSPSVEYLSPELKAESDWLTKHGLTSEQLQDEKWKSFSKAQILEIQARTDFARNDPMEVIATADETKKLIEKYADLPYLCFPEDRQYAIRMTDDLPVHWIQKGASNEFYGEAMRGEFFVFQIGIYASKDDVKNLTIDFSDLHSEPGNSINADKFCCFNSGGTDWLGRDMEKTFSVYRGKVGAIWIGLQIPENSVAGKYEGTLKLCSENTQEIAVKLSLSISEKIIEECGDNELWRLSRLRWLNSTIGIDDNVVAPYTPLEVKDQKVKCLGRIVQFGKNGLPESIRSNNHEILEKPVEMVLETDKGKISWQDSEVNIVKSSPGTVIWKSQNNCDTLQMNCQAKMEFDGYINFQITLKAQNKTQVKDIRLEIPIRKKIATYMMGMGRKGGYRPKEWKWSWDENFANNSLWLGEVEAGLHCKLKGTEDTWDLYNLKSSGIPQAWGNEGKGGCNVSEIGNTVTISAYSGERIIEPDEELLFCFGLLITPVKTLDSSHWNQRYYHAYVPVDTALDVGANIINIHHGNELNPYINYPFIAVDKLSTYVNEAHKKDVKVKIYYTIRELSNRVAEMWALRSLGDEVFVDGNGGGYSWLREHLVTNYAPAWHHRFPNGEVDAAIATTGLSRWHNYYLEGLRWLLKHIKSDGLYLDGIGYNREIMQRVRKVMDQERPGCLIDFHSGNNFHPQYGLSNCANQYMEHFPYIDSLWFGEGFDYDESPDYWLVEVSGIPFGLFGEMLHGGGNPWRGMIYGMTARYYQGAEPKHIWKIWDDFGIQDAKMSGYWVNSCPVKTDHEEVLATVYSKKDKALIALASWAKEPVNCRLEVNWNKLGLDKEKTKILAPAIENFQEENSFELTDEIPVEPGRGWLLILTF